VVRENIAVNNSPRAVIPGLIRSPGHRANLQAADVSQAGVGVVADTSTSPPVLYVTQLLMEPLATFDPATAPDEARQVIAGLRREAGLRPLRVDPALVRLARAYIEHQDRAALARLKRGLRRVQGRYRSLISVTAKVATLAAIARLDPLSKAAHTHYGLALRERDGQINVFLLLGSRR
jgi:uncharacterized protein YkwD